MVLIINCQFKFLISDNYWVWLVGKGCSAYISVIMVQSKTLLKGFFSEYIKVCPAAEHYQINITGCKRYLWEWWQFGKLFPNWKSFAFLYKTFSQTGTKVLHKTKNHYPYLYKYFNSQIIRSTFTLSFLQIDTKMSSKEHSYNKRAIKFRINCSQINLKSIFFWTIDSR